MITFCCKVLNKLTGRYCRRALKNCTFSITRTKSFAPNFYLKHCSKTYMVLTPMHTANRRDHDGEPWKIYKRKISRPRNSNDLSNRNGKQRCNSCYSDVTSMVVRSYYTGITTTGNLARNTMQLPIRLLQLSDNVTSCSQLS